MKNIPDDTIYRTPCGTRVRIVKSKEFPPNPLDPDWLKEIKARPPETITVAEVKNGKRWHGYKREDLMTETEFLKKSKHKY
jgi:hypothetical protein